MKCNLCDDQCACCIDPLCSFCTHVECEICGQPVCEDRAVELKNYSDGNTILVCPDCGGDE